MFQDLIWALKLCINPPSILLTIKYYVVLFITLKIQFSALYLLKVYLNVFLNFRLLNYFVCSGFM